MYQSPCQREYDSRILHIPLLLLKEDREIVGESLPLESMLNSDVQEVDAIHVEIVA